MKIDKIPTTYVTSPMERAMIEATNNRRAVTALRYFLRWALYELGHELGGDVIRSAGYENAWKLLADTTPRKLRGR